MAECCSEPDVAETVMLDRMPAFVLFAANVAPPHPFRANTPAALTASNTSMSTCRRFFHPIKQNATASADPGRKGFGPG